MKIESKSGIKRFIILFEKLDYLINTTHNNVYTAICGGFAYSRINCKFIKIVKSSKILYFYSATASILEPLYSINKIMTPIERHQKFTSFIIELFTSKEIDIEEIDMFKYNEQKNVPDVIITDKKGKKIFGEIKTYKSKYTRAIIYALNALRVFINEENGEETKGLLFITSVIDYDKRVDLENEYNINIIDRNVLFYLTKDNYKLNSKFEKLILELSESADNENDRVKIPETYDILDISNKINVKGNNHFKNITKGSELCKELKLLKPGKKQATEYEKKCEEILKYLFDNDLTLWKSQNNTDDTLHRFDLITKISSINDFWKYLARDFESRFVIFEFKNYTDKITQNQIYSTEKYLFTKALRTIAYVITRKGANDNAIKAMRGSLREYGKLIMCLDDEDLCNMLHLKDSGDDPNIYLSDKLDGILIRLSR